MKKKITLFLPPFMLLFKYRNELLDQIYRTIDTPTFINSSTENIIQKFYSKPKQDKFKVLSKLSKGNKPFPNENKFILKLSGATSNFYNPKILSSTNSLKNKSSSDENIVFNNILILIDIASEEYGIRVKLTETNIISKVSKKNHCIPTDKITNYKNNKHIHN